MNGPWGSYTVLAEGAAYKVKPTTTEKMGP
jgi:hypothetical protein